MLEPERIKVGPGSAMRVLRMETIDDEPAFIFDCRIPGRYLIRYVDQAMLDRYLESGRDGRYQKSSDRILWIERMSNS